MLHLLSAMVLLPLQLLRPAQIGSHKWHDFRNYVFLIFSWSLSHIGRLVTWFICSNVAVNSAAVDSCMVPFVFLSMVAYGCFPWPTDRAIHDQCRPIFIISSSSASFSSLCCWAGSTHDRDGKEKYMPHWVSKEAAPLVNTYQQDRTHMNAQTRLDRSSHIPCLSNRLWDTWPFIQIQKQQMLQLWRSMSQCVMHAMTVSSSHTCGSHVNIPYRNILTYDIWTTASWPP